MVTIINVKTESREEFVDITSDVKRAFSKHRVKDGICTVYIPHTTAGVTINENADPAVRRDILAGLRRLIPATGDYKHSEGNSDAHLKSSLIGSSVQIPIHGGRLQLGTWQGIFFTEFDGPRTRSCIIQIV